MKRVSLYVTAGMLVILVSLLAWSAVYGDDGTDTLWAGESLLPGQSLVLPGGERTLAMQGDGNLVLYGREVERQLWQSGTGGNPGAYYTMQDDGNLVIYDAGHRGLWSSRTERNPGAKLVLEDDGNLVIYSPPRPGPLWQSGTGGHPGAYYRMQADGNLVVYSADHEALWASHTAGHPGAELYIVDGNLAIFSAPLTEPVWASNTGGNPGAKLVMQDDGNLVIYGVDGKALWSTHTGGLTGGRYRMKDGELQVYRPGYCTTGLFHHCYPELIFWRSGTAGVPDPELRMQADGNLVIYSTASTVLWETGTGGHPGSELVMEPDGNLVLYSGPEPQVLWQSGTGADDHAGAELVMQKDGNLVIKLPPVRKAIWATGTYHHPGARVHMQGDGNLVVRSQDGEALWAAGTGQQPFPNNPHLKLQSDGNLVIYFDRTPMWATNTFMPWMEKLGKSIAGFSIRELAMPGAHDSGTFGLDNRKYADDGNVEEKVFKTDGYLPWHVEIHVHWVEHHTSWWPHIPYWTADVSYTPHAKYMQAYATTQGSSIYGQLHSGIRYIDMRVLYDSHRLSLIHTLQGPDVFDMINEVNHYVRENPYEIVILDFNHFYTQNGSQSSIPDEWNQKLIDHINSTLGDLLIPPPASVNDLTIYDIWESGKQVIVLYEQDGPNKAKFWPAGKLRSKWLDMQSWYRSETKGGLQNAMESEAYCVVNRDVDCKNAGEQLWVMQGILTFNPGMLWEYFKDLEWDKLGAWLNGNKGAAQSVNGHVRDWALNGEYAGDINILLGDWTDTSDLVHTAIQLNLKKAGLDYVNPGIEGLPLNLTEPEPAPATPLEATLDTIPAVVPPADIRLEATGLWTTVDLGEGAAYDHIDGWLGATHDAGDASFPIGAHIITWSSADMAGVTGTATQTVRIVAHEPTANQTVLWPPDHTLSMVTIQANVVPSLQGLVTLSARVASNEPADGLWEGDEGPDWDEPQIDQEQGLIQIPLRVERSDLGYGRVYTVAIVAADDAGHESEALVHIDVPISIGPPRHYRYLPLVRKD